MHEEEEYVHKDARTDEPVVERLDMDVHDAASYNGPHIPDGTDMDAVMEAGCNEIAIRTRNGNLRELCTVGGIIVWDDELTSPRTNIIP